MSLTSDLKPILAQLNLGFSPKYMSIPSHLLDIPIFDAAGFQFFLSGSDAQKLLDRYNDEEPLGSRPFEVEQTSLRQLLDQE